MQFIRNYIRSYKVFPKKTITISDIVTKLNYIENDEFIELAYKCNHPDILILMKLQGITMTTIVHIMIVHKIKPPQWLDPMEVIHYLRSCGDIRVVYDFYKIFPIEDGGILVAYLEALIRLSCSDSYLDIAIDAAYKLHLNSTFLDTWAILNKEDTKLSRRIFHFEGEDVAKYLMIESIDVKSIITSIRLGILTPSTEEAKNQLRVIAYKNLRHLKSQEIDMLTRT